MRLGPELAKGLGADQVRLEIEGFWQVNSAGA